jgi:hypothetical protein
VAGGLLPLLLLRERRTGDAGVDRQGLVVLPGWQWKEELLGVVLEVQPAGVRSGEGRHLVQQVPQPLRRRLVVGLQQVGQHRGGAGHGGVVGARTVRGAGAHTGRH